jgi:hypothetical protein
MAISRDGMINRITRGILAKVFHINALLVAGEPYSGLPKSLRHPLAFEEDNAPRTVLVITAEELAKFSFRECPTFC